MKPDIHTLQDTLAFQLQKLYYTKEKLRDELPVCANEIASENLKAAIITYASHADIDLTLLERIFDYLMQEPESGQNKLLLDLLAESRELLEYTHSPHLRDIIMISCLQNINAFLVSSLKTAYMFTVELDLDTASDMLQQMLEWELETGKTLAKLAIEEFNKGHALLE